MLQIKYFVKEQLNTVMSRHTSYLFKNKPILYTYSL